MENNEFEYEFEKNPAQKKKDYEKIEKFSKNMRKIGIVLLVLGVVMFVANFFIDVSDASSNKTLITIKSLLSVFGFGFMPIGFWVIIISIIIKHMKGVIVSGKKFIQSTKENIKNGFNTDSYQNKVDKEEERDTLDGDICTTCEHCRYCGEKVDANSKYCPNCGAMIDC